MGIVSKLANSNMAGMCVVKRNGLREHVSFDKITRRMESLCTGSIAKNVDVVKITQKVCSSVFDGIKTSELDILTAETSAAMTTIHPDYALLAGRILASNLHKSTPTCWIETLSNIPTASAKIKRLAETHRERIESVVDFSKDLTYDFFAFRTMEKSYLARDASQNVVERPQHMLLRVAFEIHSDDVDRAIESYVMMSEKQFIHASPTLFNAGTTHNNLSSCFLVSVGDDQDSISGIYKLLADCAQISRLGGGIGIHVHRVRGKGSKIKGTGGSATGIVPMLRVFNATARYVDQSGRRKGSIAVYVETHHSDIMEFLELRKNTGAEEERCRDLFLALWVSDLFMTRVQEDREWSLFSPDEAPGLDDVYGDAYRELYELYEYEGRARKTVKAKDVWRAIVVAQIETGTPYVLNKDAVNKKNAQKNLGVIRSSNLCSEITLYSSPKETAVCNLASLSLPAFVAGKTFDFEKLRRVTRVVTRNLNHVIDNNKYPIPEAEYSNKTHRPIGIGVQGLADVFAMLGWAFESPEARALNRKISEHMYFASLEESCEMSKESGPYDSFRGSPASERVLQFDMWDVAPEDLDETLDWNGLRERIYSFGLRNSLSIALMPTASTSQILNNNECFEPFTSMIYTRRTLSGDFVVVNKHLVADLDKIGLWTEEVRSRIVAADGSVQNIPGIPDFIKDVYKTVWEIKQKAIVDQAADRGPFVDQSQSMNLWFASANVNSLTNAIFYAWKRGLKTLCYYVRSKPASTPVRITVDPILEAKQREADCLSCGA